MAKATIDIPLIVRGESISDAKAFLAGSDLGLNSSQQAAILAYFIRETVAFMDACAERKVVTHNSFQRPSCH